MGRDAARSVYLIHVRPTKASHSPGPAVNPLTILRNLNQQERQTVVEFFGTFAGAEFTLKQRGFIKSGSHNGATADWDNFATSISGQFQKQRDEPFRDAWEYLIAHPPRKQVAPKGRLSWKEAERPRGWSDEQWGFVIVRRVRNNLFHGAKFVVGGSESYSRDVTLVRSALVLVQHALEMPFVRAKIRATPVSE